MKTLTEHNAEKLQEYYDLVETDSGPVSNGIACPSCGNELFDSAPNVVLPTLPQQKRVHCDACGYGSLRYV